MRKYLFSYLSLVCLIFLTFMSTNLYATFFYRVPIEISFDVIEEFRDTEISSIKIVDNRGRDLSDCKAEENTKCTTVIFDEETFWLFGDLGNDYKNIRTISFDLLTVEEEGEYVDKSLNLTIEYTALHSGNGWFKIRCEIVDIIDGEIINSLGFEGDHVSQGSPFEFDTYFSFPDKDHFFIEGNFRITVGEAKKGDPCFIGAAGIE